MPHIIAGITQLEEGVESKILPHLLDQFCHSQLDWTDRSPEEITRTFIAASLEHLLEVSRENLKSGQYYVPFHIQHLDPNHPTMH